MSKVSVVVPYYRAGMAINQTLQSLANQSRQIDQLVLVNDGCQYTDDYLSYEFVENVAESICWVCLLDNYGVSAARNFGLTLVEHEYVAFLDSDELWAPSKNKRQLELLAIYDLDAVAFVDSVDGSWARPQIGPVRANRKKLLGLFDFIFTNPVIMSSVCVRWSRALRFEEHLYAAEDLYLWAGLLLRPRRFKMMIVSEPLVYPLGGRVRNNGLSSSSSLMLSMIS